MNEQMPLLLDDDGAPPARLLLCGVGGGGIFVSVGMLRRIPLAAGKARVFTPHAHST